MFKWLEKFQNKYTSPDMQNEMISIIALHILRAVGNEPLGKWYTIMIDKTCLPVKRWFAACSS